MLDFIEAGIKTGIIGIITGLVIIVTGITKCVDNSARYDASCHELGGEIVHLRGDTLCIDADGRIIVPRKITENMKVRKSDAARE